MHRFLEIALPIAGALVVLGLGFLAGRKWRRDYKSALDQWQRLESAAKASAQATASAHGNQVQINVDSGRELNGGSRDFWLPAAVRPGLDRGSSDRAEALTRGDDGVVYQPDGLYRPTRISRVLFGSGRSDSGGDVGRESGPSSDGG